MEEGPGAREERKKNGRGEDGREGERERRKRNKEVKRPVVVAVVFVVVLLLLLARSYPSALNLSIDSCRTEPVIPPSILSYLSRSGILFINNFIH